MGEVAHIPNHDAALRTLVGEHDRLVQALMVTIDLVGSVQEEHKRIHLPNLRKAAGKTMRDSIEKRDVALAVLMAEAA